MKLKKTLIMIVIPKTTAHNCSAVITKGLLFAEGFLVFIR